MKEQAQNVYNQLSTIDERAGLPESSYNSSLRHLRNEYPNISHNEATSNTAGLY